MNSNEKKRIKQLNIEDFIWVIYIGIIILSFYSNSIERKYFIYRNLKDKEKYREINIIIFSILLIVYIYFFISSLNDFFNLKQSDTKRKKELVYLSLIASFFILLSGLIFLYIAFSDKNLDVEIAFN